MTVGLILNLMKMLNKSILCEPLVSIILFYSTSSINLVMNLHHLIFYLSLIPKKNSLLEQKDHFH